MKLLKFAPANSKLVKLQKATGRKVYSFSLMSGHNCPYAKDCKSMAVQVDGKWKIQDGKDTVFRCFSASQEALLPMVRQARQYNVDAIMAVHTLGVNHMRNLIVASLPKDAGIVRIHVGGDFFSQAYFDAWIGVANLNPHIQFYAYTKSLPFWIKRIKDIPANLCLTASRGGTKDKLIKENGLIEAVVVGSESEAKAMGLEVDNDDSHAAITDKHQNSFALIVHGTQPKGGKFSKIVNAINRATAVKNKESKAKEKRV